MIPGCNGLQDLHVDTFGMAANDQVSTVLQWPKSGRDRFPRFPPHDDDILLRLWGCSRGDCWVERKSTGGKRKCGKVRQSIITASRPAGLVSQTCARLSPLAKYFISPGNFHGRPPLTPIPKFLVAATMIVMDILDVASSDVRFEQG